MCEVSISFPSLARYKLTRERWIILLVEVLPTSTCPTLARKDSFIKNWFVFVFVTISNKGGVSVREREREREGETALF